MKATTTAMATLTKHSVLIRSEVQLSSCGQINTFLRLLLLEIGRESVTSSDYSLQVDTLSINF
jgi:hypothetical protein